jgi:hypothetical protein
LEPPDLEKYLRWGFLRARPGLRLSDFGHDSNVFFSPYNEEGDYKIALSPRLEGLILFGDTAFLTFDEELKYTAYFSHDDLNYLDQRGRARLTVPLGKFGLFSTLKVNRTHDRPYDADDIRTKRSLNEFGFGGIVKLGWRTNLEVSRTSSDWSHQDDDYNVANEPVSERLDRTERNNRIRVSYRLKGITSLTLAASNGSIRFDTPNLTGEPGEERDSREIRILPGIRFDQGGPIAGSLEVGWARLRHLSGSQTLPDFSGAVGDAELYYRIGSGSTLRLDAERRVDFSVYQGNNYYTWDKYKLTFLHYLNRLIGLEVSASTGDLAIAGDEARNDDVKEYGAGFRLRLSETDLGRRVEYSFKVNRIDRQSTDDFYDRSHTLVSVSAVIGY